MNRVTFSPAKENVLRTFQQNVQQGNCNLLISNENDMTNEQGSSNIFLSTCSEQEIQYN